MVSKYDDLKELPPLPTPRGRGRPLMIGDKSPEYTKFLEKYGLDKEQWLNIANGDTYTFSKSLFKKAKAMEILRKESEAIIELWNSSDAKGLTVYEDLLKLSIDIQARRQKMEEADPDYDPLEDKVLQKALQRKQDMIIALDRMKIDVQKMMSEEKARRNSGKEAIVVDGNTATVEDLQFESK